MDDIITLDYGSGGKKTAALIDEIIVPELGNAALNSLGDHWFWADEFADAEQMHRQMAQLAQQMLLK